MYVRNKNKKFAHFLKQKANGADIEEQCDASTDEAESDEAEPTQRKFVHVFDTKRSQEIKETSDRSSNLHKNHKRLLTQLGDTNGQLPLVELPESIFDDLDELCNRFPNFLPAIDFYKQEFALSRLAKSPIFTAQPLLILSPPGCGKTQFCHELAQLIGTHFEFISMASMTAGFVLSGNSSKWSEGSIGRIAQSFVNGLKANPLIVADEIDKAGGDRRYETLGSLYTLLEKFTAEKFIDEALEIPIDASHIVWVATGNYIDRIAEPIVSRFTIIEIDQPSAEQMPLVMDSIYKKVRENHSWGNFFHEALSGSVIDKLVDNRIEPRLVQKILINACGKTVLRTGSDFDPEKHKLEISVDDLIINKSAGKIKSKTRINQADGNQENERDVVIMPIFNIPISNNQNQEEVMILWSVFEIEDGNDKSHHLVGYLPKRQTDRVTSAVKQFEKNLMRLITSSGRIYQLDGPPALNGETKLIWLEWKEKYNVTNDIDVTHQYLNMH